jgi:hypothetical protein
MGRKAKEGDTIELEDQRLSLRAAKLPVPQIPSGTLTLFTPISTLTLLFAASL